MKINRKSIDVCLFEIESDKLTNQMKSLSYLEGAFIFSDTYINFHKIAVDAKYQKLPKFIRRIIYNDNHDILINGDTLTIKIYTKNGIKYFNEVLKNMLKEYKFITVEILCCDYTKTELANRNSQL